MAVIDRWETQVMEDVRDVCCRLPPMKAGPLAGDQATEPKEPPLPLPDQWVGSQVQQAAVV